MMLRSLLFLLMALSVDAAFLSTKKYVTRTRIVKRYALPFYALPSPEESAKALTDYMAKAHEEKIRAMATVEAKYQDRIKELEDQVKQLEARSPVQTSTNTYAMPATNKGLSEMVNQYRTFLSEYLVKAQIEKVHAVATAEAKLREKYDAIVAELETALSESAETPTTTSELTGKVDFQ